MAVSTFIVAVVATSRASNPVFLIYTYLVISTLDSISVSVPSVVHAIRDIPTIGSVTVNVSVTDKLNEALKQVAIVSKENQLQDTLIEELKLKANNPLAN